DYYCSSYAGGNTLFF
nr:immunoglobulin light chain junction region [Macaca mulatta]MOX17904.1 immunoglobulin light chain junction region [Macaca mulatta]